MMIILFIRFKSSNQLSNKTTDLFLIKLYLLLNEIKQKYNF